MDNLQISKRGNALATGGYIYLTSFLMHLWSTLTMCYQVPSWRNNSGNTLQTRRVYLSTRGKRMI
ncbi:hypothetical protein BABINDRAFT_110806 [Babjeviella inositovora NRRL Y-12698]|uniref:Uncharacterized protein n=1 Tax=Babjeviella inositovora NRRL Y-12698 TaxID=984486 RepID=A0A1E3QVN8_9ASCO|nr:uncharacterized protein BABINDRAFT_110806 [Babjeviella inositovora NRRL Y-12698]ODQ81725.1 hypothetical protein BABINDRAFT_110806 [Babjeviella inositovora NRRL Y-12698]